MSYFIPRLHSTFLRERPGLLSRIFRLGILLCLGFVSARATFAAPADTRGEARVSVFVDLTAPSIDDDVSIRIMRNTDPATLESIVRSLAVKLRTPVPTMDFVTGDPEFPDDHSVAVKCLLPVVPRGESYLPIAPLVEAFAPYASRLRIIYVVNGTFVYRGYSTPYADRDVSFTVDLPQRLSLDSEKSLAFYGMDVMIKNPSLTSIHLPAYPEDERKSRQRMTSRVALAIGAALIIIALGLFLALLLPKRQIRAAATQEESLTQERSTGGSDD